MICQLGVQDQLFVWTVATPVSHQSDIILSTDENLQQIIEKNNI